LLNATKEGAVHMKVSMIGLDIAKSIFQVHGVDASGRAVLCRKLRRGQVETFFSKLAPCVVGLEACGTAHYWARALGALGHEVRLVPPAYVKGYVKRGKNDAVDAAAICEAASRPSMHFVPVKSGDQQAALTPHRAREMLVKQRTMLINTLRSQLAEFGLVAPKGGEGLTRLMAILHDPAQTRLPELARQTLLELAGAIEALAPRIRRIEKAIRVTARDNPTARRLMTIPGIGPITAAAFVASVGDPTAFDNGRHFATWLGLTPKQHSTANRVRLGRISKMGDRYLRKLLVLGATSRLKLVKTGTTPLDAWTRRLLEHKKKRLVCVAVANKTARILWAVMATGQPYQPDRAAA
jgi:transposase